MATRRTRKWLNVKERKSNLLSDKQHGQKFCMSKKKGKILNKTRKDVSMKFNSYF